VVNRGLRKYGRLEEIPDLEEIPYLEEMPYLVEEMD
jgi:hypothetical protein